MSAPGRDGVDRDKGANAKKKTTRNANYRACSPPRNAPLPYAHRNIAGSNANPRRSTRASRDELPLRPRAQILSDFRKVIARVYAPDAYFARLKDVVARLDMSGPNGDAFHARLGSDLKKLGKLVWSITRHHPEHRGHLWRMIAYTLRTNPRALNPMLQMVALYVHLGPFSRTVLAHIDAQIAQIETGTWQQPALVAAE